MNTLSLLKKTLSSAIIFSFSLMLFACQDNEETTIPNEVDTIAPIIQIPMGKTEIYINLNQNVNLKDLFIEEGFKALDNVDGDITQDIVIKSNDFNISIPGDYVVDVYVYDRSGNKSEVKFITVTVVEYYGLIQPYNIFLDAIKDENTLITPQSLFQGAWYHKSISSNDSWLGIEGVITLPEVDIKRYDGTYDESLMVDPNAINLDNPSIYLGGKASYESDVGLSFSKTLVKHGSSEVISKGSYAFRPFWRYITSTREENKDLGGYDLVRDRRYAVSSTNANETNMIANWYFGDTQFYYLPGDQLRMIVYSPKMHYLQLQIEVLKVSTLESSVAIRAENGWNNPENFLSPVFVSSGHGTDMPAHFKRVNAIDQSRNEGNIVIPTQTSISVATWESVYLHRKVEDKIYRIPFNEQRSDTLSAPEARYFTITKIDPITGGFSVAIHPGKKD